MGEIMLYHAGFEIIKVPDVRFGRRNADFGQGFYLSPDAEFSRRWARARRGMTTYINTYALNPEGLDIRRLQRDEAWFDYIFDNRAFRPDRMAEADVILGPIANDTIYDVWGLTTSGLIERSLALRLLQIGPAYIQVALKSPRAAAQLQWRAAVPLSPEEIEGYRALVRAEEADFQRRFAEALEE